MLVGGAGGIRANIDTVNELNVFPVPDGDTGTNMSKTFDSGISHIPEGEDVSLGDVAHGFGQGALFGARGNSGVILSQFFAGLCGKLEGKESVSASELAEAYAEGVRRSYAALTDPVEGTILTVFRESTEHAASRLDENSTLNDFLRFSIDEAERSLKRTKTMLRVLEEADVVDSGGAGYLCIAKGMYDSLSGREISGGGAAPSADKEKTVDYGLFTARSELLYGYCTECLVRLQYSKGDPEAFDTDGFRKSLAELGCESIAAVRTGDILKVHAHTKTPSDVLAVCQRYGEFLNVKIENMTLQHSEREAEKPKLHKRYGIVAVATGEGMTELFKSLGADTIITGGQTCNPSAEEFIEAFEGLDCDDILVFPNNGNVLLTALQAMKLWEKNNVTVIPSKTMTEGYSALSVFNGSDTELERVVSDLNEAMSGVISGEITVAIRDCVIGDVSVREGEYIGIIDGQLKVSGRSANEALMLALEDIEDIDDREIITLFAGQAISPEECAAARDALEERFPMHTVDVFIGGQQIYDYLIAAE